MLEKTWKWELVLCQINLLEEYIKINTSCIFAEKIDFQPFQEEGKTKVFGSLLKKWQIEKCALKNSWLHSKRKLKTVDCILKET